MDPIVAVRVRDTKDGRLVTAFTSRGKNRKQVWSVLIADRTLVSALAKVDELELSRASLSQE